MYSLEHSALELSIISKGFQLGLALGMDKLKLTGQNPGRVFKSRLGRVCIGKELYTFCKTAKLKVENLAQTTFRVLSR